LPSIITKALSNQSLVTWHGLRHTKHRYLGVRFVDVHWLSDANLPTKMKIDVALCFVLPANRSLVSILHNNG
jgi:hypothetical protein